MGRYICEVRKDRDDNILELVHADKYDYIDSPPENGSIKFQTKDEFNRYFRNHCISEDALRESLKSDNSLFTFLFWSLLLIFIITIGVQMCNSNNGVGTSMNVAKTSFGRFSF